MSKEPSLTKATKIFPIEIKAEYLDIFDNVVTTDWTNGSRLGPGETQDFSIMHKTSSKIHDVKLSIQEVS